MSRVSGPMMSENLRVQRLDDALGVVDRERRLRHIGDRRIRRDVELVDFLLVLHQRHRRRDLAHRAFDFRMARMADQDQLAALADIALALIVHLGDERAGRVQHRQVARARLPARRSSRRRAPRTPSRHSAALRTASSTNTAPLALRFSTTCLLCTISWRT